MESNAEGTITVTKEQLSDHTQAYLHDHQYWNFGFDDDVEARLRAIEAARMPRWRENSEPPQGHIPIAPPMPKIRVGEKPTAVECDGTAGAEAERVREQDAKREESETAFDDGPLLERQPERRNFSAFCFVKGYKARSERGSGGLGVGLCYQRLRTEVQLGPGLLSCPGMRSLILRVESGELR